MTCSRDKPMQLTDGAMVCTWCPRWRLECEAAAVLAMPTKEARQLYLRGGVKPDGTRVRGVLGCRGENATAELERAVLARWHRIRRAG